LIRPECRQRVRSIIKWISEVVSAEETSTQVEVGFTDALAEGPLEAVERRADELVDLDIDDEARPTCSPCPTTAPR
jgi:hypothetical protein